jgi:hypothetical protein
MQQQYWPLDQLAARPIPELPAAPTAAPAVDDDPATDEELMSASQKSLEVFHAAA